MEAAVGRIMLHLIIKTLQNRWRCEVREEEGERTKKKTEIGKKRT